MLTSARRITFEALADIIALAADTGSDSAKAAIPAATRAVLAAGYSPAALQYDLVDEDGEFFDASDEDHPVRIALSVIAKHGLRVVIA